MQKKINKKYKEFNNQNILPASVHNQAWNSLQEKITNLKDCHSVIDNFINSDFQDKEYEKNLTSKEWLKSCSYKIFNIKEFTTKAESKYISCTLASIIAHYFFIGQIEGIRDKHNLKIPFGNSYEPPNSVITAFRELEKIIPGRENLKIIQKSL